MSYSARPLVATRPGHVISTRFSDLSPLVGPVTSATYPVADLAIYIPVLVTETVIVRKLLCVNGAAVSGNVDVGLYNLAGTRLVAAGTTAQAGTSVPQIFDVTDTVLMAACYYLAVVLDNTTGTLLRDSDAAPIGVAWGLLTEQLGAGAALPVSATFAVNQTLAYLPYLGMLVEATVA